MKKKENKGVEAKAAENQKLQMWFNSNKEKDKSWRYAGDEHHLAG